MFLLLFISVGTSKFFWSFLLNFDFFFSSCFHLVFLLFLYLFSCVYKFQQFLIIFAILNIRKYLIIIKFDFSLLFFINLYILLYLLLIFYYIYFNNFIYCLIYCLILLYVFVYNFLYEQSLHL